MLELYKKIRSIYRYELVKAHIHNIKIYDATYIIKYISDLNVSKGTKYLLSRAITDYLYTFSKISAEQADIIKKAFKYNKYDWSKQVLTDTQIKFIIEIIDKQRGIAKYRNKLALLLMLITGCRVGELLNIRICDIKIDSDYIYLDINNSKGGGVKHYKIKRDLKLYDLQLDYLLLKYIENKNVESTFLFSNDKGQKITKETLEYIFRKADVHPHQIRHTAIYNKLKDSNIYDAAKLAGHKSLLTTQRYIEREYTNIIG